MKKIILIMFIFLVSSFTYSQDVDLNLVYAKDEFKWGVKFYNLGLYEKSVFSFERSLSFNSSDLQTHLWLGKAYYMKGDVEAALQEWAILKAQGESPLWLDSSVDIISAERGVINRLYSPKEWVPLYNMEIARPSSILPLDDGSSIIVSFMSNTLTKINANGAIISNFNGGFEAFNRPFDLISDSGSGYIVSELMGNKISFINNLGLKTKSINPESEPLSGPGYLTKDNKGYFYVSDIGNRRVCKFDMEGNFILSITHELLIEPSGILAIEDNLYVADQFSNNILLFDGSGNYIDTPVSEGLENPEGLSLKEKGIMLIADSTSLKEYEIDKKLLTEISDLHGKASKITKGVVDINGNTLTTDFNLGEFYSLTDVSTIYSGLYMIIDRVSSNNFPDIRVEFQVLNRLGQPIIGLDNSNFLISENNKVVPKRNIVFKGSENNSVSLGLILDLEKNMEDSLESFYDISIALENELVVGDTLSLIKAGPLPIVSVDSGTTLNKEISSLKPLDFSSRDGIDLSIKLAASTLIPSKNRREIVLVTSGLSNKNDFTKYSLDEIRDFLKINRIALSIIYVNDVNNEELEYLVADTGGTSRYLYKGKGSKGLLNETRNKKTGFYIMDYTSLRNIDNGELYTGVELEVNYIRKSGRSESGFFVPVKIVE